MTLQQLEMVLRTRAAGSEMGLNPQKGGLGAGSIKPMVPLLGEGSGRTAPGEEASMDSQELEDRRERREEVSSRSKEAANA